MGENKTGLVHIYCGDGKGKTTAAAGLAARMSGAGKTIVFAQFFKSGNSSEIKSLRLLPGVQTMHSEIPHRRFSKMAGAERVQAGHDYKKLLDDAISAAREGVDLLVLDEVISACNHGVVSEEVLVEFLRLKPERLEIVLTGRDPSETLLSLADYITEMRKIRHPYDAGVHARWGVEL